MSVMDDEKKKKISWITKKGSLFFILIFSLVVLGAAIYWFAIQNNRLSKDYQKQTNLTVQEKKFDNLYLFIQTAESEVRGYASSENKKYIKNVNATLDSIRINYQELKSYLKKENSEIDQTIFTEFDNLIQEKILFLESVKKLCDENNCVGALQLIATERGIQLTSAILELNKKTNSTIRDSFLASNELFARLNRRNNRIAYLGIAAAMLAIIIVAYLLRNEIKKTKKISEQLRIQKDYLRITLNSVNEGLIATDKDGRIMFMNPHGEQLTGWTTEEVKGLPLQKVYNVFNEETGKPFENVASRILKEGKVVAFENNTILRPKSNDPLIISNNGSPLLDENGNVTGVVLVFRDITQQKANENKIKDSVKKFSDLIQNLPEAIYTCDSAGYIQLYNKAAAKLWGREPVIGKDLWCGSWKIFKTDGSELPLENCPMAIVLREAIPVSGQEVMVQRQDGSFRHVLPSPTPLFDANGKLSGAVNMLIDITDKKEREILIKKTEEKYKNLIDQASDSILIYSLDGTIHEFNDVTVNISGYSKEEFAKLNLKDLLIGEMIQDPEKIEEIKSGKSVTISRQFKRKDGTIIDLESKAKMLADGKILAFARDITERNKTEATLRRLKESYLALINNVDGIVWEADAKTFEFSFVSSKAERLLGYPKEMWTQQPTFWADHIYKEDRSWAIDFCIKCTKDKVAHDFEYRMVAADGSLVWLRDMVSVQVENDEPVKLIGIMVDITKQKLSEKEAEEKNKQLQLLAEHLQEIREEERASMAREIHDELGQLLTIMKMDVSWIQENCNKEDEAIIDRTNELRNLLDQTVNTVRRIAYELRPSILDDMGLVAAIEWQLAEFEKRAGVKATYEGLKTKFPISDTAKTGLFRIVQESLTNVGRYAKAKNVRVSLTTSNNSVFLKIIDDGVGFEPEKLAFKKTLGIVGMKERCIMLGGEFQLDSTPGTGTKIKISIPLQENIN